MPGATRPLGRYLPIKLADTSYSAYCTAARTLGYPLDSVPVPNRSPRCCMLGLMFTIEADKALAHPLDNVPVPSRSPGCCMLEMMSTTEQA